MVVVCLQLNEGVRQHHAVTEETIMRTLVSSLALLLVLGGPASLFAQVAPPDTPPRAQVIAAAKDIMQEARYSTLITIGRDGQPQARIVDPFPPDSDLTIWIATNPLTRKAVSYTHLRAHE